MLKIENVGGDPNGVCTYRLSINDKTLFVYPSNRPDGLEVLLRDAADFVASLKVYDPVE